MGSFAFASALNDLKSTASAAERALAELSGQIGSPVDLMLVFAAAEHRDELKKVAELLDGALAPSVMLALTCQGVLGSGRELESGPGLSILAATLPGADIEPLRYDGHETPEALRNQIHQDIQNIRAIILFADPFSTPQQEMIDVVGRAFEGVPIVGGMASGASQPGGNTILLNGRTCQSGAVGVAIGGNVHIETTVSQGCRPIGRAFVITKSHRNVVQELGGRKALDIAQEIVAEASEEDQHLVAKHALFVGRVVNEYKQHFGRGDFLIRNIVGADQDQGYLALADPNVRVGQTIQFQVRDGKAAAEDLSLLLEAQQLYGPAAGALLCTCNGRGSRLFGRPHADSEIIEKALGHIPLAGFFAMGEIGPVGDQNCLHGHTASLLVFRNAKKP